MAQLDLSKHPLFVCIWLDGPKSATRSANGSLGLALCMLLVCWQSIVPVEAEVDLDVREIAEICDGIAVEVLQGNIQRPLRCSYA